MTLRVGRMLPSSVANGPGQRFVVWVQGCALACTGCFNPELWTGLGGAEIPVEGLAARIHAVDGLRGVTLSGGEPLEQPEAVADLLDLLDPRLDIVIYTGFTWPEIVTDRRRALVMARADLLVAGRFDRGLASETGLWSGSSNKTVHPLTGRIGLDELPECRIEVQIAPDGGAVMTGFPPGELKALFASFRQTP